MTISSRRDFMNAVARGAGGLGALATMAKFGEMNAAAQATSSYKAIVCIYLAGGNDSHNMVVPINTAQQSYNLYAQSRAGLAIPQASLLGINNGSDQYGLHFNMPEIQSIYNAGHCAVLSNVGMLTQPTTKAIYQSNNLAMLPPQLFSHSDQQNQWQAAIPSGALSTGWGGRVEDSLLAQYNANAQFSPVTSTSGCGLFCTGQQTFAATVPVGGASLLQGATTAGRLNAVQQLMTFDNGLKLVQAANAVYNRGVGFSQALNKAIGGVSIKTPFPPGILGQQLQTVAKVMAIQSVLNINRQVFFCQLGGFDTHGAQSSQQDPLMQQLSQALGAFFVAMAEVQSLANTVVFTASEFGRTLQPNGNAGTDHAWGSHHLIIGANPNGSIPTGLPVLPTGLNPVTQNSFAGGKLAGGQFYGNFPSLVLGGNDDANFRGTLVPTTSVDQYAATIAQWFGVSPSSLGPMFPYLHNFTTSNLGFLG